MTVGDVPPLDEHIVVFARPHLSSSADTSLQCAMRHSDTTLFYPSAKKVKEVDHDTLGLVAGELIVKLLYLGLGVYDSS